MYQRPWSCRADEIPGRETHAKPWVLVEDASPAVRVSDFSRFREAGFEVALCSGPDGSAACPRVEGERCALADAADIVLFALDLDEDAGQDVLRAHLVHDRDTPVVVALPRHGGATLPEHATTCTVLDAEASVDGQMRALRSALSASGRGQAAPPVSA